MILALIIAIGLAGIISGLFYYYFDVESKKDLKEWR